MPLPRSFLLAPVLLLPFSQGCFSTLQTARIDRGINGGISLAVLRGDGMSEEERANERVTEQGWGMDSALNGAIGYGFVRNWWGIEAGTEFMGYWGSSDGFYPLLLYGKLGLMQDRPGRIALLTEFPAMVSPSPYAVTLLYSREMQHLTPYVAVKKIVSHGIAGDDPMVTRFQKPDQDAWVLAVGVERKMNEQTSMLFEGGAVRDRHDLSESVDTEVVTWDAHFGWGIRW